MRRNLVLDGLRVRQFDDIQDEIGEMVDWPCKICTDIQNDVTVCYNCS